MTTNTITWTQYQQITQQKTNELFALVAKLQKLSLKHKKDTKQYARLLNTLQTEFADDAQDFISYYGF